jgi:hypothetical protein
VSNRTVKWIREAGSFYLLLISLVPSLAGCATRGQVRDQMAILDAKQASLERLQARLDELGQAIDREEIELRSRQDLLAEARAQALLASDQAREAEVRAAGRLLGETVFELDGIGFDPGTSTLTAESRTLLDQLAERLRAEDASYYLEVQSRRAGAGMVANGGGGVELARARAEAVRRYLHVDRGLPLHALSAMAAPDAPAPAPAEPGVLGAETSAAALALEPVEEEPVAVVVVVRPFPRQ